MNSIQQADISKFAEEFLLARELDSANFLITGATGLIGSTLVHCLLALDKNIAITCPVRSIEKAKAVFGEEYDKVNFIEGELLVFLMSLTPDDSFQYIVHCASPTAGKYMSEHPVETYELAVESTRLLLNYAKEAEVNSMVYISSLEYYGQNLNDNLITEDFVGYVNPSDTRSCYPLGKRAAEYLCTAYANEYGVNVKSARLTQTFGAGVSADDNRVFAQFARSVITGKDIILHTTGESAKPYCYTTDCVSAILHILLKGENGEAYNVANQDTYISIREMAEFLREKFNQNIKVVVEEHPEMGYAPVTKLHLSSEKLMTLGWSPKNDLKQMFERLINSIR